jgi:hypothetical protein
MLTISFAFPGTDAERIADVPGDDTPGAPPGGRLKKDEQARTLFREFEPVHLRENRTCLL